MSLSFEVSVVRDIHSQLNPMLQVLDACNTAGVSYPQEVIDFFGDALEEHGTDAARLRAALENVQIQVAGDPLSEDGATIRLDDLPEGTKAIRITAHHEGNGQVEAAPVAVAAPVEVETPVEVTEPFDSFEDDLVQPEPEPVLAFEPEPAPIAVPSPATSDTVEFDEPIAEFQDDSVLAVTSEETQPAPETDFPPLDETPTDYSEPFPDLQPFEEPVAETFEEPDVESFQNEFPPIQAEPTAAEPEPEPMAIEIEDEYDILDIDEPLDIESPTAISQQPPQVPPAAYQTPPIDDVMPIEDEPLDLELDELIEATEPVQQSPENLDQLDLIRQQESQIVDRNDDLVLAVEDDLLDIDDLDDPLELDEPAEQM